MGFVIIEALERRTLLSRAAVDSVQAVALGTTFLRPENPEEWETYGNIEVTWTRAASSRIDGYHVFRSEVNEPYEQIAEATDTSFVDSELGTGWQYQYQVRPFTCAEGDLASLGTASATTPLPEPF